MWFQKNKWKIIVPILILAVLAVAFFFGDRAPDSTAQPAAVPAAAEGMPSSAPQPAAAAEAAKTPENTQAPEPAKPENTPENLPAETPVEAQPEETPETGAAPTAEPAPQATETAAPSLPPAEEQQEATAVPTAIPTAEPVPETTEPVPAANPEPETTAEIPEQPAAEDPDTELTCTISICCSTILNNMDLCDPDKRELVPESGWILGPTEVTFREGESVFDVLQRVCREHKIHMEFEFTPLYDSAYIEGIFNLYEFDVGELSGWMYKVNDWFPNYGCSRYQLKNGDVICWVYTCDLGYDVGGGYAAGG